METVIGQEEIIHKHQVKSAAVDNNIQAPNEKINHHYGEDGRANSKLTLMNNKNTEDLSQMMCNLLRHKSVPNVEIEAFTENTLDYHSQYSRKLWSTKLIIHMTDWYDF